MIAYTIYSQLSVFNPRAGDLINVTGLIFGVRCGVRGRSLLAGAGQTG
jgi:hypothetical protein